MPYINTASREALSPELEPLIELIRNGGLWKAGDLNYIITRLAMAYMAQRQSYARYNDVIGALECAKLELYRRRIAPYEDGKIKINGDVE